MAENEGSHFLIDMERRLGVRNLMTTAKHIVKMDPVVRVSAERRFWSDFDHAKRRDEPSGESFSSLMVHCLDANYYVHRALTQAQLIAIEHELLHGSDTFGLDRQAKKWFTFMLDNILSSSRVK